MSTWRDPSPCQKGKELSEEKNNKDETRSSGKNYQKKRKIK